MEEIDGVWMMNLDLGMGLGLSLCMGLGLFLCIHLDLTLYMRLDLTLCMRLDLTLYMRLDLTLCMHLDLTLCMHLGLILCMRLGLHHGSHPNTNTIPTAPSFRHHPPLFMEVPPNQYTATHLFLGAAITAKKNDYKAQKCRNYDCQFINI